MLGGWIIAVYAASSGLERLLDRRSSTGSIMQDVWMGLIKPFFLGFVIVTIGCHVGLRTSGGTQGVGRATTNAVVAGVGRRARRRLLRDAAADLDVLLMRPTPSVPTLGTAGRTAVGAGRAGRRLRPGRPGVRRQGDPDGRQLRAAPGHTKIFLGASGAGQVDDPEADARPAEAGFAARSGSTASASTA